MTGTDTVALACILSGAAFASGVTMAVGDDGPVHFGCATVVVDHTPDLAVVTASVDGHTSSIVVTPSAEVLADCAIAGEAARPDSEQLRRGAERARRVARERVRRIERERVDRIRERIERRVVRVEDVELELEGLQERLEKELGERLEADVEYLIERLEPFEELEFEFDGLEDLLESELEGLDALLELELGESLESELERLIQRLERTGGGIGG